MKRRLALLLSAAMLTVSLAGCGGGNSSSSGNAGSGNASGEAAGGGAAGGAVLCAETLKAKGYITKK